MLMGEWGLGQNLADAVMSVWGGENVARVLQCSVRALATLLYSSNRPS